MRRAQNPVVSVRLPIVTWQHRPVLPATLYYICRTQILVMRRWQSPDSQPVFNWLLKSTSLITLLLLSHVITENKIVPKMCKIIQMPIDVCIQEWYIFEKRVVQGYQKIAFSFVTASTMSSSASTLSTSEVLSIPVPVHCHTSYLPFHTQWCKFVGKVHAVSKITDSV